MLSPGIIMVKFIVKLATVYVNYEKMCWFYVIILTGHGDFGDKDIVYQAKVLCVVCIEKNLSLKPEASLNGNVFFLVLKWLIFKSRGRAWKKSHPVIQKR